LSGATAEFIQILMEMTVGSAPFSVARNGELTFSVKPVLPAWLFTKQTQNLHLTGEGKTQSVTLPEHSFSFMLLGDILVTYLNPKMKNTYGTDGVSPTEWNLYDDAGNVQHVTGTNLNSDAALLIRSKQIHRMEIVLN